MTQKLYSLLVLGGAALVAGCGDDSTGPTQEPQTGAGGSAAGGAGGSSGSGGLNVSGSPSTGGAPQNCCPAECWSTACACTNGICCWLNPSLQKCQNKC